MPTLMEERFLDPSLAVERPRKGSTLALLCCDVKIFIGNLYLAGGCLLLPGFLWIVPEKVITIPVKFNPAHIPIKFITVPVFNPELYARGVNTLIAGMACVLLAALLDLFLVHCRTSQGKQIEIQMLRTDTAATSGKLGVVISSVCQVLGAAALLAGCIVFLPQFSTTSPPKVICGIDAPDLGNDLFQAGAVLYFMGACLAIFGTFSAIYGATLSGRRTAPLWASVVAFLLFICTSTLFFVNGRLPTAQAVIAGQLRVAASVCLLTAICILYVVTIMEVRSR